MKLYMRLRLWNNSHSNTSRNTFVLRKRTQPLGLSSMKVSIYEKLTESREKEIFHSGCPFRAEIIPFALDQIRICERIVGDLD